MSTKVLLVSGVLLLLLLATFATATVTQNEDLVFDPVIKTLIERHRQNSLSHRMKRGFWDFLGQDDMEASSNSTLETSAEFDDQETGQDQESFPLIDGDDTNDQQDYNYIPGNSENQTSSQERKPRQSGEDLDGNEYAITAGDHEYHEDYDGSGQIDHERSTAEPDIDTPHISSFQEGPFDAEEPISIPGSGLEKGPGPEPGPDATSYFYRVTTIISAPYRESLVDRSSPQFRDLVDQLSQAIDALYKRDLPNHRTRAKILKFLQTSDPVATQVSLDIESTSPAEEKIRSIFADQLQLHTLGNIQARPDGFSFRNMQDLGGRECNLESEFACQSDGECLPISARCDGILQCIDESDEANCTAPETTTITEALTVGEPPRLHTYPRKKKLTEGSIKEVRFSCVDEGQLGARVRWSREDGTALPPGSTDDDGVLTIPDVRAEHSGNYVCEAFELPANTPGRNITAMLIVKQKECLSDQFRCSSGQCISRESVCDQSADCHDGSDESNCGCGRNEFECRNGNCVRMDQLCDLYNDCGDNSDEENCVPNRPDEPEPVQALVLRAHPVDQVIREGAQEVRFMCRDESPLGVPVRWSRADGSALPPGSTDNNGVLTIPYVRAEYGGAYVCEAFDVPPGTPGQRITAVLTVSREDPKPCSANEWRCENGPCIPVNQRCNNHVDCPRDDSDELDCNYQVLPCSPGEWRCENGPCIPLRQRCNGRQDCPRDNSDELDCPIPSRQGGLDLKTYPNDQIIKESREIVITCRDEGPLRARVVWSREDGAPLPTGSTDNNGRLELPNVQVIQSGNYVCEAVNVPANTPGRRVIAHLTVKKEEVSTPSPALRPCESDEATCSNGECISKSKVCDGRYDCTDGTDEMRCSNSVPTPAPPSPIIDPAEWIGGPNDTIRLVCTAPPGARVTWTRSENAPLPVSADEQNGVLTIYNPIPSDSGDYICTAIVYMIVEARSTAKVTIQSPPAEPPSVRVEPEWREVFQGSLAEVKCIVTGDPTPVVTWTKRGNPLPAHIQTEGNTLRIIDPQVSDRGVYVCHATNSGGSAQGSAVIDVNRREMPVLELNSHQRQVVRIDDSASLQCRATKGIPTPSVSWARKDGRPFSSNVQQLPDGVLRFNHVTPEDGGSFTCSASNEVGSVSLVAIIEISTPPEITISPSNDKPLKVRRGDRVRLTCTASGQPNPSVEWKKIKNGIPRETIVPKLQSSMAVYEISSVSYNVEGSYTCVATNAYGPVSDRIQIRVEDDQAESNTSIPIPNSNGSSGGVTILEERFRTPEGGKVEMRCQVYGNDQEAIHLDWKRNDGRNLPQRSTVRGGILLIPAVTKDDHGIYLCQGLNTNGNILSSAATYLEVISPPRIELDPIQQVVRPGESPSVMCRVTGDQPIEIKWHAIDRPLPNTVTQDGGFLQFDGITSADAGEYVCKATNNAGTAVAVAQVLISGFLL